MPVDADGTAVQAAQAAQAVNDTIVKTTVIKCALLKNLANHLSVDQRERLLDHVDRATTWISCMSRRASLFLQYHTVRMLVEPAEEQDQDQEKKKDQVPDLKAQKDSYWRDLLKIGLKEFGSPFPDEDTRKTFDRMLERRLIDDSLSPRVIPSSQPPPPMYVFDQVLTYAAHQLQTAVVNNLELPLMPRIERLCKAVASQYGDDCKWYRVRDAIRVGMWDADSSGVVSEVDAFVKEARALLGLREGVVLYENTASSIPGNRLTRFLFWMCRHLQDRGRRGLILSPVFGVQRHHVRFDQVTLIRLVLAVGAPTPLEEQRSATATSSACGRKKQKKRMKQVKQFQEAVKAYNTWLKLLRRLGAPKLAEDDSSGDDERARKRHAKRLQEHYDKFDAGNLDTRRMAIMRLFQDDGRNPNRDFKHKPPTQTMFTDVAAYEAAKKAARDTGDNGKIRAVKRADFCRKADFEAAKRAYEEARAVFQRETAEKMRRYEELVEARKRLAMFLFDPKMIRKGADIRQRGAFTPSVATDGVSVSFQFEKRILRPAWLPRGGSSGSGKAGDSNQPPAKRARRRDKKTGDKGVQGSGFDPTLSQVFPAPSSEGGDKHVVVAGLDPGRTNIVTIVVYDDSNKKMHVWKLSRGQYHMISGIHNATKAKARRYRHLHGRLASLGRLKTVELGVLERYLARCRDVEVEWWEAALKRRESRTKFANYICKRKAMDGFFARVWKEMRKEWPADKHEHRIAYGSAGPRMKATGRGELAVPTTGAYKSCKRVFNEPGNQRVELESEVCSTCTCACCGSRKEKVFARGDGKLLHAESAPVVAPEHVEMVNALRERLAEKGRRRRGGDMEKMTGVGVGASGDGEDDSGQTGSLSGGVGVSGQEKKRAKWLRERYPEIRGLRFCPKCRSYRDRDVSAARAIGLLCVLRLLGHDRPECFMPRGERQVSAVAV